MAVGFVVVAIIAAGVGGAAGSCLGFWAAVASGFCSGMLAPIVLVALKLVSYARCGRSEPVFLPKQAHS